MALKKSSEDCLKWIAEQQNLQESVDHGLNKKAISEETQESNGRLKAVLGFRAVVEQAANDEESNVDDGQTLIQNYATLEATAKKRLECLQTLSEIAELEDLFEPLWKAFSATAILRKTNKTESTTKGWTANTSQNCIVSRRNAWEAVAKMLKCVHIHLDNAANYHQFFLDIEDYSQWMVSELGKADDLLKRVTAGQRDNMNRLIFEVKTVLTLYLHWKEKTNSTWMRSLKVVPVPLRMKTLECERPVIVLASYKTKQISVFEGEELTLLDKSQEHLWKVRNLKGDISLVPSTILLIPGPDLDAVDAAFRLRLQFLFNWTNMIKRAGKTIINFLLHVIRDWTSDEEAMLKSLDEGGKTGVRHLLTSIGNLFSPHWDPYAAFETLKARMVKLDFILYEEGNLANKHQATAERESLLLLETEPLEELLSRFKDFWQHWEQMKIAFEGSQHPEYMLALENPDDYKLLTTSEVVGRWAQSLLDFDESEKTENGDYDASSRNDLEKKLLQQETHGGRGYGNDNGRNLEDGAEGLNGSGRFGKKGDGDLEDGDEGPEGRGRSGKKGEGDWEDGDEGPEGGGRAGRRGNGNLEDGDEGPEGGGRAGRRGNGNLEDENGAMDGSGIQVEMAYDDNWEVEDQEMDGDGWAENELCTIEMAKEKTETSQFTTSEQEERQTFVITSVIDPRDGTEISMKEAISRGIILQKRGRYVNPDTKESIPIPSAMNAGKIKVELTKTNKSAEKKSDLGVITIKTYREVRPFTVKGVTDVKTERQMSTDSAVKAGILDLKRGVYKNLNTLEEMTLGDALDSGLLNVEFETNAEIQTNEDDAVAKTYEVSAVVDAKGMRRFGFLEAVANGLINTEAGTYHDRKAGQHIPFGDAIRKGFIKATVVSEQDIDPGKVITNEDSTAAKNDAATL